jgi:hypothetical protein
MTNKNYYIGTRVEWSVMNKTLNQSVSRLNEGLSKDLRSIALEKGIKKTEQGNKLLFYSVSSSQLESLMSNDEVRPLVKVENELMSEKLNKVNSSFPRRMNPSEFSQYKKQLNQAMRECVEVIGTDTNKRETPTKVVGKNPYKVGDWIDTTNQHSDSGIGNAIKKLRKEMFGYSSVRISDAARVCKVSDKSYWIEIPFLKEEPTGVSNYKWAECRFDNLIIAKGCNSEYQHDWDWTIPYEGNEDAIEFIKVKTPIRLTQWEIEYPKHTKFKGYRSEYTQRD